MASAMLSYNTAVRHDINTPLSIKESVMLMKSEEDRSVNQIPMRPLGKIVTHVYKS